MKKNQEVCFYALKTIIHNILLKKTIFNENFKEISKPTFILKFPKFPFISIEGIFTYKLLIQKKNEKKNLNKKGNTHSIN